MDPSLECRGGRKSGARVRGVSARRSIHHSGDGARGSPERDRGDRTERRSGGHHPQELAGPEATGSLSLDYAYPEWNKKAAGFVGYGSVGGARAIEQLRLVLAELQMATIRTGVYIQGADFMAVWREGKELKGIAHLEAGVKDMLDQLVWWTRALKTARDQDKLAAAA